MLIYTQTSQPLHRLNNEIVDSYMIKDDLVVGIDTLDGFAWPWMWYLREYQNVIWIDNMQVSDHDYDYLLINSKNIGQLSTEFLSDYNIKRTIPHREWFPENIYRDKTIKDFAMIIFDNKNRISISEYYLDRKFKSKKGATNFILLKSKNFESIE